MVGEFLAGVAVAVILSPVVQYLFSRRSAQAEAAYGSRVGIYAEMFSALTRYKEHVKWTSPNTRGPAEAFPDPDPWTAELELSMSLHASTVIRTQIEELLTALNESKWQSFHHENDTQWAITQTSRSFEQEWVTWRATEHARLKFENDKWADECLRRIKDRMRFELYGWMPVDNMFSRRRVKPIAKRIAARRTNPLTGGVDPSMAPDELRVRYEAHMSEQSETDQ